MRGSLRLGAIVLAAANGVVAIMSNDGINSPQTIKIKIVCATG